MTFSFHPQERGTSFVPLGTVVLTALLLVLPFAPTAHGINKDQCTGTTVGGSPVAWDGPDSGGKCVLLDMLLIKVAAGTTVDAAEEELKKRTGWTARSKFALFNTIIAKTSQTFTLDQIKAEQSHFSSQSWTAIVELDAVVSAADLVPPVTGVPVGRTDEGAPVDLLPNFPDESSVIDQDYTPVCPDRRLDVARRRRRRPDLCPESRPARRSDFRRDHAHHQRHADGGPGGNDVHLHRHRRGRRRREPRLQHHDRGCRCRRRIP